jgi:hypothetical protein
MSASEKVAKDDSFRDLQDGDLTVVIAGRGGPNNVRKKPKPTSRRIGKIPEHAVLAILPKPEGWSRGYPYDDGVYVWCYVRGRTKNKRSDGSFKVIEGWTVAGKDDQSFLRRMPRSQGCLDTMGTALDTHLQQGQEAYVLPKEGLNVRKAGDPHAAKVGALRTGTVVTVTGDPECDSKMVWWQVEPLNAPGSRGWASEGNILEWFLAPLTLL